MGTLRTILRRSFYSAAALSTLLLLATLILWPVSNYRRVYARYVTGDAQYWFAAESGRAAGGSAWGLGSTSGWGFGAATPDWPPWSYLTWSTPETMGVIGGPTFLGVCWYHTTPWWRWHGILIPFSYLAVLFSILPLLAFRSIRRRRRAVSIGLCPKCGYDLRAQHAGSGGAVCPECGTPVAGCGPSPGGGGRP